MPTGYDYEVRDEKEAFKGIPSPRVPKEMVELASHILDKKAGHFDPAKFKDEYELALRKLVKRKSSGKTIERTEPPEDRSNVIDLMAALQQSLGRGAGSGGFMAETMPMLPDFPPTVPMSSTVATMPLW